MSAQPEDLTKVSNFAEYLRDFYDKMKDVDQVLHSGMEDVRNRLAALALIEKAEVQERLKDVERRLAAGESFERTLTSSDLALS